MWMLNKIIGSAPVQQQPAPTASSKTIQPDTNPLPTASAFKININDDFITDAPITQISDSLSFFASNKSAPFNLNICEDYVDGSTESNHYDDINALAVAPQNLALQNSNQLLNELNHFFDEKLHNTQDDIKIDGSADVNGNINGSLCIIDDYDDNSPRDSSADFNEYAALHINPKASFTNSDSNSLTNSFDDVYDPVNVEGGIRAVRQNNGFPIKNKAKKNYEIEALGDEAINRCKHVILKAKKKKKQAPGDHSEPVYKHYFFKVASPEAFEMTFYEALANSFYRRLVPDVVSSTSAIYDDTKYVGAVSKKLEASVDVISKKIVEGIEVNVVTKELKSFESFRDDFYSTPPTDEEIKKLAQVLMSSYLFEEDDLHRGNIGKIGRIDFDMSFWTILYRIKGGRFGIDHLTRNPEESFKLNEDDIRTFPLLQKNYCHYFPTKTGMAENNFSEGENQLIATLKDHPVFIKEKFRIALKFLLTMSKQSSKALCSLHIKDTAKIDGKSAVNVFISKIDTRKTELQEILYGMPEFYDFLTEHGNDALQEIIDEVSISNAKIEKKLADGKTAHAPLAINIDELKKNYAKIKEEAIKKRVLAFEVISEGEKVTGIQPSISY